MDNVEIYRFPNIKFDASKEFEPSQNQDAMDDLRRGQTDAAAPAGPDSFFSGAHVGSLMLGTLRYPATISNGLVTHEAIRTIQRTHCSDCDHYFFCASREHAWQSTSETGIVRIDARQLFFADPARPLCIDVQSGDVVILIVPRNFIPIDLSSRHGTVFSGLMASLASQYIVGLAEHVGAISHAESKAIGDVTLNMLLAATSAAHDPIGPVRTNLEIELTRKVKTYINNHLESPKLCVDSICHDIGLSRAALYRLFSRENLGVAEYIKLLRLRKIYYILRHSTESRIRISELADRYGFCYNSSFAKLFKRQFGCAPSEIRRNTAVKPRSGNGKATQHDVPLDFNERRHFPTGAS
ncbi:MULTISPECIES: AraC family transcriptional regulator [unclassified Burkholderia]|uniref:helix-turn-helix domain-containing protein n=1 Tax=unclassified Burkholderia TaxID=2613784 RepID=UPI000AE442C1|nr:MULTISPECIES: AraC family transcriptional regulator [unclassified Burkholderia]